MNGFFSGDKKYSEIRVLVIEDEPHIRLIIISLLRQIGYRKIDEASDGTSGMRAFLHMRPDVVLCDIHMEPVNGLEFLRKVRSLPNEEYSEVPVVFLTSDKQKDTVLNARDLHVDGYLAKPVSQKKLAERLDAVLVRPKSTARKADTHWVEKDKS